MEISAAPEMIDWENMPWFDSERQFTLNELAEINIFQKQGRFIAAKEKRRVAHKRLMRQLEDKFYLFEEKFTQNIMNPFASSIWESGIEETRKRSIPPYAFDRFLDLPKELQLLIWTKTIMPCKKQTHSLMSMNEEYSYMSESRKGLHNPFQTTAIFRPHYAGAAAMPDSGPVVIAQVCPDARKVYRDVYARLLCRSGEDRDVIYHSYDMRDKFYMGQEDFADFKLLIDLIILQHTTRPFLESLPEDIAALRSMRNLIIDLNIFGGAPANMWMQFPRLETLTIAFYPYTAINDADRFNLNPESNAHYRFEPSNSLRPYIAFFKPRRNKKFVRRADTILSLATKSLRAVSDENPTWKTPRLEVVVTRSGDEWLDWLAEEEFGEKEKTDKEATNPETFLGMMIAEGRVSLAWDDEEDSEYLAQLPARMSHPPISAEQIKRWKQRYHPSRSVDPFSVWSAGNYEQEKRLLTGKLCYISDSEGGSEDERPFCTVDPGEEGLDW